MQFVDFKDFSNATTIRSQSYEGKITKEIMDLDDELTDHESLIEAQFRLVNSKDNKRNNDAKINRINKWKIKT